ncbi:MAG: hypothetical protein JWL81_335 [Verrucomicrobiales bacterium]|nr:hypothetical protein [Verrucomicrobiales bacterium]
MRRFNALFSLSLIAGPGILFATAPLSHAQAKAPATATATATALPPKSGAQTAAPVPGPLPTGTPDCRGTVETMKADFAREPGRVLLAVEDALTTQETCVCPVVRAAVDFVGSDSALTAQIVVTSIRAVPSAAARITECAISQSPEAAEAIRSALARELGVPSPEWLKPSATTSIVSEPAPVDPAAVANAIEKNSVTPISPEGQEPEADYGFGGDDWPTVNVSGIYVLSMAGNGVRTAPVLPSRLSEQVFSGKKKTVHSPILPVTPNIPQ